MVYIYVCKRFKNTMEMVSGRDGEWVNNVLQFYCKHGKLTAKLERAEINPKKRSAAAACAYDSSTDVFKINLVYKDAKGQEHELKWLIKVTRSDVNEVAEALLRHEKQGWPTGDPLIERHQNRRRDSRDFPKEKYAPLSKLQTDPTRVAHFISSACSTFPGGRVKL